MHLDCVIEKAFKQYCKKEVNPIPCVAPEYSGVPDSIH